MNSPIFEIKFVPLWLWGPWLRLTIMTLGAILVVVVGRRRCRQLSLPLGSSLNGADFDT